MADEDFETLLKRMPEIAEAINSFQSEAIQREAFQALVANFGNPTAADSPSATAPAIDREAAPGNTAVEEKKSPRKPRTRNGPYVPKLIKNLDLAPTGKKPFPDFIKEKQPKSNEDKYAVVVYYLQHELEVDPVTLDHIATVFRLAPGWKEPKNVQSGVTTAASRKGTIDSKDFDDIKTTPHGRNFVEHELPPKQKAK